MLAIARTLIWRDLLLALRRRSDVATALLFFVIVASLFPLGIGAEPNLLRAIAPGVIWVAALLSSMLSLLVLPLYVPVLILGAGAVEMAAAGLSGEGQLLLLGAMLIVAAVFAPWATAAALRISSE